MVATKIPLENIAHYPALLPTSIAPRTTLHMPWTTAPYRDGYGTLSFATTTGSAVCFVIADTKHCLAIAGLPTKPYPPPPTFPRGGYLTFRCKVEDTAPIA